MKPCPAAILLALVVALYGGAQLRGAESIWIEAEHLHGIRGSCFPDMAHMTDGHWAISGPGIAPEWTQGGESEWLSIACGPDDDRAAATYEFEVPEEGQWTFWVRYRDWRESSEQFVVRLEAAGVPPVDLTFGQAPVIDENDELKLLWQWAFGWDSRTVNLPKGTAKLTLLSQVKQPGHRQVDAFCLTTDDKYRPQHRDKPVTSTWRLLDELRKEHAVAKTPLTAKVGGFEPPEAWKLKTFNDQGFVYLWNVGQDWLQDLASQDPKRVPVPYHTDAPQVPAFREMFGGRQDVPIFSDPRIAPAFHGAGPNILENPAFVAWLEANPNRAWGNMMNYIGPMPLSDAAKAAWQKYKDRYVGNISGENLGYFDYDAAALATKIASANSRRQVFDVLTETFMAANGAKQKLIFGGDVPDHYLYTIPCQATDETAFAHACREWGARTIGYENSAVLPSLAMRIAFQRGRRTAVWRHVGGLSLLQFRRLGHDLWRAGLSLRQPQVCLRQLLRRVGRRRHDLVQV